VTSPLFADPGVQSQALAAGFASVELYLHSLVERDADRLAVEEGIAAARAGLLRPFDEFEREFRAKHGLPPRE
jgi:hypothetical protein